MKEQKIKKGPSIVKLYFSTLWEILRPLLIGLGIILAVLSVLGGIVGIEWGCWVVLRRWLDLSLWFVIPGMIVVLALIIIMIIAAFVTAKKLSN